MLWVVIRSAWFCEVRKIFFVDTQYTHSGSPGCEPYNIEEKAWAQLFKALLA